MRCIRLGVVIDQDIKTGGGYQQALNAALLAKELPSNLAEVIFFTTRQDNVNILAEYQINAKLIHISLFGRVRSFIRREVKHLRVLNFLKFFEKINPREKPFLSERIDLVYFLEPSAWARDLEKINYITTVWDLCHRDELEFPEVRSDRQFELRERNYRAILPKAAAIIADSEVGKNNIARRYGVDSERIHIIPFQGAASIRRADAANNFCDIRTEYGLLMPFIFYPAQYWAHKNHIYLLQGLKTLEEQHNLIVGAIFSGGDFGNLAYIQEYADKLGLSERIRYAGFLKNEEIMSVYRYSLALVMPTYFGPTNLPPLEAFQIGVPVLYPDRVGLKDQVGEGALLMDLKKPESMAQCLVQLIEDKSFAESLVNEGRKRMQYFDSVDRLGILGSIIEDFCWKRMCWK